MGEIIRLNQSEVEMAESFLSMTKSGEITHGVICYRSKNGDISYKVFSPEHLTYTLGLMERCKIAMSTFSGSLGE